MICGDCEYFKAVDPEQMIGTCFGRWWTADGDVCKEFKQRKNELYLEKISEVNKDGKMEKIQGN